MEWMFLVTANNRVRVESRILQVLDHHMVAVQSFASMRIGNQVRISFTAAVDEASAIRTGDLLRKLQDVQSVDSFAGQDGLCRTLALFKVLCDHESRLALLQIVSSLGAQVVAVRPDWVTFQIIGTLQDIEGLHASLLSYGLVEAMSVASAIVRQDSAVKNIEDTEPPSAGVPELVKIPPRKKAVVLQKATV
jgi:acetolactate synthase small subunit